MFGCARAGRGWCARSAGAQHVVDGEARGADLAFGDDAAKEDAPNRVATSSALLSNILHKKLSNM